MKKLFLLAGALLAACDSPTIPERLLRDVYDFRLITPAPKTMRWPIGSTVRVFVIGTSDATRTDWLKRAVDHGADVWNRVSLFEEVKLEQVTNIAQADVIVEYSLTTSPVDLTGCPPSGGLAFTTFCLTSTQDHVAVFPMRDGSPSTVRFVISVRDAAATDEATVRRLVTHELGHVLGLAQHSPKQTDLMYSGTLNRDDPSPADRATLQVLYHSAADITP